MKRAVKVESILNVNMDAITSIKKERYKSLFLYSQIISINKIKLLWDLDIIFKRKKEMRILWSKRFSRKQVKSGTLKKVVAM